MREIRTSGSEGGGTGYSTGPPYPYQGGGAGERSPSVLRLGPSIVKERGGEAPRAEAGEPHSPVLLPSGGDFTSFKDLFASRSPRFEPHSLRFAPRSLPFEAHSLRFAPRSPAFEPSEGEGKRRELRFERREELFASHSLLFVWHSLLFASHSPELERREEEGTRLEEEGTWHFKLFARHSPRIAYHSLWGMSLDLSFGRLEERGTPRKEQSPSRKGILEPLSALQASLQEPFQRYRAGDPRLEGDLTSRIIC